MTDLDTNKDKLGALSLYRTTSTSKNAGNGSLSFLCEDFSKLSFSILPLIQNVESCFIYLDPPYPMESRRSQKQVYRYEINDDDHIDLLRKIKRLPCMVAISSYPNEMYATELKNWRSITFQSTTRQGQATEVLYMNYDEPKRLHDYTYLGEDFRQRELIKKKYNSMKGKISRLSPLEKEMLLEYIYRTYFNGPENTIYDTIP